MDLQIQDFQICAIWQHFSAVRRTGCLVEVKAGSEVVMKLGSLFDGIGGWPLAATKMQIDPVWAAEIEPFPIEVTKKHFPTMKHLGGIS